MMRLGAGSVSAPRRSARRKTGRCGGVLRIARRRWPRSGRPWMRASPGSTRLRSMDGAAPRRSWVRRFAAVGTRSCSSPSAARSGGPTGHGRRTVRRLRSRPTSRPACCGSAPSGSMCCSCTIPTLPCPWRSPSARSPSWSPQEGWRISGCRTTTSGCWSVGTPSRRSQWSSTSGRCSITRLRPTPPAAGARSETRASWVGRPWRRGSWSTGSTASRPRGRPSEAAAVGVGRGGTAVGARPRRRRGGSTLAPRLRARLGVGHLVSDRRRPHARRGPGPHRVRGPGLTGLVTVPCSMVRFEDGVGDRRSILRLALAIRTYVRYNVDHADRARRPHRHRGGAAWSARPARRCVVGGCGLSLGACCRPRSKRCGWPPYRPPRTEPAPLASAPVIPLRGPPRSPATAEARRPRRRTRRSAPPRTPRRAGHGLRGGVEGQDRGVGPSRLAARGDPGRPPRRSRSAPVEQVAASVRRARLDHGVRDPPVTPSLTITRSKDRARLDATVDLVDAEIIEVAVQAAAEALTCPPTPPPPNDGPVGWWPSPATSSTTPPSPPPTASDDPTSSSWSTSRSSKPVPAAPPPWPRAPSSPATRPAGWPWTPTSPGSSPRAAPNRSTSDEVPEPFHPALAKAVIARDHHCKFEGCTAPPWACDIHHRRPWAAGGPHRAPQPRPAVLVPPRARPPARSRPGRRDIRRPLAHRFAQPSTGGGVTPPRTVPGYSSGSSASFAPAMPAAFGWRLKPTPGALAGSTQRSAGLWHASCPMLAV